MVNHYVIGLVMNGWISHGFVRTSSQRVSAVQNPSCSRAHLHDHRWCSGFCRSAAFAHDTTDATHILCVLRTSGTRRNQWQLLEHFQNQLPACFALAMAFHSCCTCHDSSCFKFGCSATQVAELCFAAVRKQSFTFQDKPLEITQLCQNSLATEVKCTEN